MKCLKNSTNPLLLEEFYLLEAQSRLLITKRLDTKGKIPFTMNVLKNKKSGREVFSLPDFLRIHIFKIIWIFYISENHF